VSVAGELEVEDAVVCEIAVGFLTGWAGGDGNEDPLALGAALSVVAFEGTIVGGDLSVDELALMEAADDTLTGCAALAGMDGEMELGGEMLETPPPISLDDFTVNVFCGSVLKDVVGLGSEVILVVFGRDDGVIDAIEVVASLAAASESEPEDEESEAYPSMDTSANEKLERDAKPVRLVVE
jgi:hypothetical protein